MPGRWLRLRVEPVLLLLLLLLLLQMVVTTCHPHSWDGHRAVPASLCPPPHFHPLQ